MTSLIKVANINDKSGAPDQGSLAGAAKVWGIANADTVALIGSLNVSGIADEGTGRTSFSFTDNMGDTAYAVTSNGRRNDDSINNPYFVGSINHLVGSIEFLMTDNSGTETDVGQVSVALFGDLA